jgi:RNA polymerase sigma-70 factor (ECF subfamily)
MSQALPLGAAGDGGIAASVVAARNGDHAAFAVLVQRFSGPLHRYLTAMGLGGADAEDVLQETFLRGWNHLPRYDATYAFSTWIYTIARRLALNHLTRQKPRASLAAAEGAVAAGSAMPEDGLWAKARDLLSERDFSALWLRYGEDRDLSDIARILGITAINARVTLHRARGRLAGSLGADYHP